MDRRLGLGRTSIPAFTLNAAVDQLLKNEFDLLRQNGKRHELMKKYGVEAVPYNHPDLPVWRDDMHKWKGACTLHQPTNLEICGIVDDLWINKNEGLHIVDYKATSTSKEISLEDEYKENYKKQMEVYQWIFRRMGYKVSDVGYFVFANAGKNRPQFDGRLEFELEIISHEGNDSWVEPTVLAIKECLDSNKIPSSSETCEHCKYRKLVSEEEKRMFV